MHYFCTYFDRNFLYQGLALYKSLQKHAGDFTLWVLCFDDTTFRLLTSLGLPGMQLISLTEFESAHEDLMQVKSERSAVEYYFTTTPLLPMYILKSRTGIDKIAYLDADLFFYDSVQSVYSEWGNGSIYIVPHRFHPDHCERAERVSGRYNVGIVGIRNDSIGIACLERWGEQCLKWCYLRSEPGLLGDQKYLDEWPTRYSGVVESKNVGIGAGAWNMDYYRIRQFKGRIFVENVPLVMLHLNFIGLVSPYFFAARSMWSLWPAYRLYAAALAWAIEQVKCESPNFEPRYERLSMTQWLKRIVRGGIVPIRGKL